MFYLKKEYKPPVKKVFVKQKVRVLPDYINETTIPNIVRTVSIKEKPLTNEDKIIKQLDQMLTLEDYKVLLKLLKEKKLQEERKHKGNNQFNELLDLYKETN